ncbi:MAG: DUF45 domain-containing protein [Clostridia bacterium]|nr:DUF45 domain-containing protein [Clostridia bacterium]
MATASFKSMFGGFEYTVARKRIKNVNLRVRSDGSVAVSAPYGVPEKFITEFVEQNSGKILDIIKNLPPKTEKVPEKKYSYDEERAFLKEAERVCRSVEPLFFGGKYKAPQIELCRGHSRWGYCMPRKKIIRLNVRLSEYPEQCLRYVAIHEYCHLLVPNHSAEFYAELEKRMPDWKRWKKRLGEGSHRGLTNYSLNYCSQVRK